MIAEWFLSYTLASKCSALWSRTNYGVTHQEVSQRSREDRGIISWPEAWNPKDTTVTATLALFPTGKKLLSCAHAVSQLHAPPSTPLGRSS